MNDWEESKTSGGLGEPKSKKKASVLGTELSLLVVVVLMVGAFAAVLVSQKSTENRSRAEYSYSNNYQATSPATNETWQQGTSHVIRWVPGTSGTSVTIKLIDVPKWKDVWQVASNVPDSGSYTWMIPTSIPSSQYKIYICAASSCSQYAYGNNFYINGGYVAPTAVPTPTAMPTSTPTNVPTPLPTSLPTPTPSPLPTEVPEPIATPEPGDTMLLFTLGLHGIGTGGDASNPSSHGNMDPDHTQRPLTVEVYNSLNQLVTTQSTYITFDTTTGKFKGEVATGDLATGFYTVKVKTDQYLRTLLPGIQQITAGATNVLTAASLIGGDFNDDNSISILDYNILMGCFSDLLPAVDCPGDNQITSDINDDGNVNQFDYNLFLRELGSRSGN